MKKIKVGIMGYGNLGKGLVSALQATPDMELIKVFTRRDPKSFQHPFMEAAGQIMDYKDKLDVLILALGSATDIPQMAPELATHFNLVDTYDNHQRIPEYYDTLAAKAKPHQKTAMIGMGWDPGLFSLNRLLSECVLPHGKTFTFWGKGVSQGHSDALKRIKGVKYAVQYTVPKQHILDQIEKQDTTLQGFQTHDRQCFVVTKPGFDKSAIEDQIIHMENYFKEYDTEVNFISEEDFKKNHQEMFHGGHVIRVGETGEKNQSKIDFSLTLKSNPEFTARVAVMGARAVYKMNQLENYGVITILDTPAAFYSALPLKELIKNYL